MNTPLNLITVESSVGQGVGHGGVVVPVNTVTVTGETVTILQLIIGHDATVGGVVERLITSFTQTLPWQHAAGLKSGWLAVPQVPTT